MKILYPLISIVLLAQGVCQADVTKLAAEQKKAIHEASVFRTITSVRGLPPSVVALCADHKGKIAELGQKWQVTDVIFDETLPMKRLIWAVTDGQRFVVHYESGGIGHGFHFMLVQVKQGEKPSYIWHGVGPKLKDFGAFLAAIDGKQIDDQRDYYY